MKQSKSCPKCGSTDLLAVEPGLYNSFPTGFFSNARIQRYVCCRCGYAEEWVDSRDLYQLREALAKKK